MGHQVIVLDRNEVPRAVFGDGPRACPILGDTHAERLEDGLETYEITIPEDHEDAAAVVVEGFLLIRDPEVDGSFRLFRIKRLRGGFEQDGRRAMSIYAESAAIGELNGAIIRPVTWTGATAQQAVTNALAGTRWQPGIIEWAGSRTITIEDFKTAREVLLQLASEFGGELRFRAVWRDGQIVARYVDLLQQRGRRTGKRFEYRKDIRGLSREEDTTELATALIGVGASLDDGSRVTFANVVWSKASGDPADKPAGQDWIGDPEALARWGLPDGRHLMGVYEDPDEQDPERLLEKTWAALQERVQGRYTYEVNAVLLEEIAGLEHERVSLGDTVTVHDTSLDPPLVLEARIIELERSYVDPAQSKVTLGHFRKLSTSLPAVVAELQRKIALNEGLWAAGGETVHKGPQPPDNPEDGQLWVDTSREPNVLYRYDAAGGRWVKVTPTVPVEIGAEVAIAKGPTPPANPTVGQLWIDTSSTPHALKQWDGSTWVKSTPTQASEIGAETPAGAQAKANAAESNAKSYAEQKAAEAEQNAVNAVASGSVPIPTSALQGAIDAALNLIRASQGYLYIDGNGLVVYDRPIEQSPTKAVKIGSGGIALANAKDAQGNWIWRTAITADGIVANEVTTGTMRFDRVRGGTAELGGSGNGSGLLIVRDASGVERGRIDNAGVRVTDANFLLQESRTGVTQNIVAATNLVNDHSFEMIPRQGSADSYQTFAVDPLYMGNMFWWQAVPGTNQTVPPRVLSTYDTDSIQLALFDYQAAVVRGLNQYYWRQYVPVDQAAGLPGPYTGSAHFAAYGATTANTTAYLAFYAVDYTLERIAFLGSASVQILASEKFKWKRVSRTFTNLPAGTNYVEIVIYSSPDVPILCDGVQFVAGSSYPAVYNPESSLWRHARGLAGLVDVENIYVPRSIRITRTGSRSVPSGTSVNIPWQARYPGYNSSGMWDPSQPDTSQIFIPQTGKYLIICTVRWTANGNGYRLLAIKVNGGNNIAKVQEAPIGGNPMYQQVAAMAHLYAGDYIQIVALQNSGTTLSLEIEAETAPVLQVIELAYPTPQF